MRVIVLYRQQSEHSRIVEEFIHDFNKRYVQAKFDVIDIDSREGIAMMSLYGVYTAPAIVATKDDGQMLQVWSGEKLPLINDVAYYAVGS
jgi:hypothetical protein